jgi:hypothetical protein
MSDEASNFKGKQNKTGSVLEKTLKSVLANNGFEVVRYIDWKKVKEKYGTELLLEFVPFKTIYTHDGRTEFLLISERFGFNMRIECKWQQSTGSVDEKLPYLYLNCIESIPEKQIMILIDGAGWKSGAIKWLRDAVKNKKYTTPENNDKTILVFTLVEFITWANNTFHR